jgi:hypothetical protein
MKYLTIIVIYTFLAFGCGTEQSEEKEQNKSKECVMIEQQNLDGNDGTKKARIEAYKKYVRERYEAGYFELTSRDLEWIYSETK